MPSVAVETPVYSQIQKETVVQELFYASAPVFEPQIEESTPTEISSEGLYAQPEEIAIEEAEYLATNENVYEDAKLADTTETAWKDSGENFRKNFAEGLWSLNSDFQKILNGETRVWNLK